MLASKTRRLPRTRTGRPRLTCTDDVLSYWVERIGLISPERESFQYSSMICRGDSLFHYGTHFELARIIRDKRGRTRLVLLNGDIWSSASGFGPSTSSRQRDVRSAVMRTDAPSIVVPFSALEGAGIDFRSIMPIHVRDDRWTIEEHESRVRPTKKLAVMPDPSGATKLEKQYGYDANRAWTCIGEHPVPVYVDNPNKTACFSSAQGWCENGAERGEDGVWRWTVRRHWLGDSLFRARTIESRTRKATADELAEVKRYGAWLDELSRLKSLQNALPHWRERGDGKDSGPYDYGRMFRLELARSRIHDQIEAHYPEQPPKPIVRNGRTPITVTRWATFLSSFDYQESTPLYFLCELPYRAKPSTVDEAIEVLKPPEVVAALARGLKVIRQGDLFAIPTRLTKRQIRRMRGREDFTNRLRVLGTNHSVTEGIVCKGGAVLGRGVMRHEPEAWRPPDHAQQKLGDGKTWHLLVRNTVPRTH